MNHVAFHQQRSVALQLSRRPETGAQEQSRARTGALAVARPLSPDARAGAREKAGQLFF
jgi:hypothetical protein